MLTRPRTKLLARRNFALPWLVVFAAVVLSAVTQLPVGLFGRETRTPRYSTAEDEDEEMDDEEEIPAKKASSPQRDAKIRPAQFTDMDEDDEFDDSDSLDYSNGNGMFGRISHLALQTFGRSDSITPLEAVPYMLQDEHFVFANVRGFVTNSSRLGGNFGVGYRRLFDDYNAWAGASLWYDADQSTSKLFQQIGLSFEGLINQWEFRSNVYLPFSSSQALSSYINGSSIVGNQLLYTGATTTGNALRGVDLEVGYSMPVMDRHVVRGFVGGYHFDGGSTNGVNGVKVRVEGVINNTFTAQALYTHDNLYGSNLMVGVSLQFPFADSHPTYSWTRSTPSPYRFVERNYNVIVSDSTQISNPQVAVDPNTNNPYLVEQVNSSATGGTPNGTTANPYSTVAAAQGAGGNVILVQSGSVLNESITLAPGQHLFGQGNFLESLPTVGGGSVPIPPLTTGMTPIIQNSAGNAVTLASNSEVAGFNITGATGNGIYGNGVSNVSIHDLVFSSNATGAINLTGTSGPVSIFNTQVNSTSNNPAVSIVNATGTTTLQNMTFNTQNGTGLYVNNASNVQLTNSSFTAQNGTAVDVESSTINASVNSVSANGGTAGIILNNSNGVFNVQGNGNSGTGGTIQNMTTAGILINSFGNSSFNYMNLTNNATGLQSTGSNQVYIVNSNFIGSTGYAVNSLNDKLLLVNFDTLSGNGAGSGASILVQSNTAGIFSSIIQNNTISDTSGTALQYLTQGGGVGSTLVTQITSNTFNSYHNGSSIIGANWNGPDTATINNNTINAYGTNMTAIALQDPSLSGALNTSISGNAITFQTAAATGGTGMWITDGQSGQSSSVSSNVSITSNSVIFQGTGGTGFRFTEYGTIVDTITANTITDQAGGGTGMLFDSVAANSALVINRNAINLLSTDTTTHRGLVFTDVGSNTTFTTVTGAVSNSVSNASSGQAFVIPNGQGVGGILINGSLILLPQ